MPPEPVRLGIWGAAGRLGSRIVQLAPQAPSVRVERAWVRTGSALLGTAVPGVDGLRFSADGEGLAACDVVMDVSLADAAAAHLKMAVRGKKPLLMAVTGLSSETSDALPAAAVEIPLCVAPNLSAGVWVLAHLVKQASRALADFDVEISETHHRLKKDAPSGTAMLLGNHVAEGRGVTLVDVMERSRATTHGAREGGTVGMSSLRGGDVVGDHTVFFFGDGERLELTHRAHSRDTFARGALTLSVRLHRRSAGRVTVPELLDLGR